MKNWLAVIALLVVGGALLYLVTLSAPGGEEMSPEAVAQSEAEALQAITQRLEAYEGVVAARDLEGWWAYWTPDARVMEPGMELSGEEFYNMGKEFFDGGGEVFSADWVTDELFVHGDVAYQIGEIHETFRYPGEEPAEAHNHIFVRWEKGMDGMWRMSRFVAGPIDAPAGG